MLQLKRVTGCPGSVTHLENLQKKASGRLPDERLMGLTHGERQATGEARHHPGENENTGRDKQHLSDRLSPRNPIGY